MDAEMVNEMAENSKENNDNNYISIDITSPPPSSPPSSLPSSSSSPASSSKLEPLKDYESSEIPYQKTLSKESMFVKLKHRIKQLESSLNLTNR